MVWTRLPLQHTRMDNSFSLLDPPRMALLRHDSLTKSAHQKIQSHLVPTGTKWFFY